MNDPRAPGVNIEQEAQLIWEQMTKILSIISFSIWSFFWSETWQIPVIPTFGQIFKQVYKLKKKTHYAALP